MKDNEFKDSDEMCRSSENFHSLNMNPTSKNNINQIDNVEDPSIIGNCRVFLYTNHNPIIVLGPKCFINKGIFLLS